MHKEIYISVIIPTYNRGYTIKQSVESVLLQTYKNLEVIIIDDNSSDNTEIILSKIKDERLRYIKLNTNKGANYARNEGLRYSNYDVVAFQDSDDIWHKNKLHDQIEFIKKHNYDVVASSYNMYVEKKFKRSVFTNYSKLGDVSIKNLLYGNYISTQTILGYKKCFESVMFDNELPRFQDWDIAIRLVENFSVGFYNIPLVDVYLQDDSISKDEYKQLKAYKTIYKKYQNLFSKNNIEHANILCNIFKLEVKLNKKGDIHYITSALKLDFSIKYLIIFLLNKFRLLRFILMYK